MKKDELSKCKYIYKIYSVFDVDKGYMLHMEKYPIIYMNSNYVYYKDNADMLKYVPMSITYQEQRDELQIISDIIKNGTNQFTKYFIVRNVNTMNEIFKDINERYQEYIGDTRYGNFIKDYRACNTLYNDYKRRLEVLASKLNKLKNSNMYKECVMKGLIKEEQSDSNYME